MKKKLKLSKNGEIIIEIPYLKKKLLVTTNDNECEIICSADGEEYQVVCKRCNFEDFEKYIAYKQLVELCNTMNLKDEVLRNFNVVIDKMYNKMYGKSYDDFCHKIAIETNFLIEKVK